jgi:hypothetical protein
MPTKYLYVRLDQNNTGYDYAVIELTNQLKDFLTDYQKTIDKTSVTWFSTPNIPFEFNVWLAYSKELNEIIFEDESEEFFLREHLVEGLDEFDSSDCYFKVGSDFINFCYSDHTSAESNDFNL